MATRTAAPHPTAPHPTAPTTRTGRPRRRPAAVHERTIRLHGQTVSYLESGADSGGPVVVLLHGLASSSDTWARTMPTLGRRAHVVAPDLLGHGRSAKPVNGDYSLGSYASGLRDLVVAIGAERATVVGHSFGGGVAMQFAYQFPELTERVVLVASGGLGPNVTLALRAATLPGAPAALSLMAMATPRWAVPVMRRVARAVPGLPGADLEGLLSAWASFGDDGARSAFLHTARGALDWTGQRLTGTERLDLLSDTPVLLVAGTRDAVIPVAHTVGAHRSLPHSRLEVFDGAGHFPHLDDPRRFGKVLLEFLSGTTAARTDLAALRRRLQRSGAAGPRDA